MLHFKLINFIVISLLLIDINNGIYGQVHVYNDNGHAYELISEKLQWSDAKIAAESRIPPFGFQSGHLATFSNIDEENFVISIFGNKLSGAWFGFTDEEVEGEWKWVDGTPGIWQDSDNFANPLQNAHTNWRPSTNEPNNQQGREHYAVYSTWDAPSPQWNDLPNNAGAFNSYLIEYIPNSEAGIEYDYSYWIPYVDNIHRGRSKTINQINITAIKDNTAIKAGSNNFILQDGEIKAISPPELKEGLHIVSDNPLQIEYDFRTYHNGIYDDGFLSYYILEESLLDKKYYVPAPSTEISVLAVKNNTLVNVQNANYLLNAGESKRISSVPIGTLITGNEVFYIIAANYSGDHYSATFAYEIFPVSSLSNSYYAPHQHPYYYQNSTDSSRIYILAPYNSTKVTINSVEYILNSGEYQYHLVNDGANINSNNPIYAIFLSDIYAKDPWAGNFRHYSYSLALLPSNLGNREVILGTAGQGNPSFPGFEICLISLTDYNQIILHTNHIARKSFIMNKGDAIYYYGGEVEAWNEYPLHIKASNEIQVTKSTQGAWSGISEQRKGATVLGLDIPDHKEFTLISNPQSKTILAGQNANFKINVVASTNFNEVIDLSILPTIEGINANFSTQSISKLDTSILNFSTSNIIATGTYQFIITGTSASYIDSTTIELQIKKPDFTLTITPNIQTIFPGDSTEFTINVELYDEQLLDKINLSLQGLELYPRLNANLEPEIINFNESAKLNIATSSNASPGEYPFEILGVINALKSAASATLEIQKSSVLVKPNPFTPNNDGFNDVVEFNFPELLQNEGDILIYDFNGKQVIKLVGENKWNGRMEDGKVAPLGAYYHPDSSSKCNKRIVKNIDWFFKIQLFTRPIIQSIFDKSYVFIRNIFKA